MTDQNFEGIQAEESVFKASPAMQASWQKLCYDLPLTAVSEWLRFASQRLQAQSEFIASLRTCQSMPDVMEAQSKFVRAAVDDYGVETSKLMEDVRSAMNKAA
ncbi:MAG: phasin family protein [Methylovirgula sp.]|jgi:hypothetical protein